MWQVVKVGAHMVQRTGFLLATLAMATAAAAQVGTPELAGHQIAAQIFLLLAITVDMFKVSGQSLVGHALGARRPDEARDVVDHLYGWAYRAAIVLTVATIAVSPLLPWGFTDDPDVVDAAGVALVVLGAHAAARAPSPSSPTASSWAPTTSGTSAGPRRSPSPCRSRCSSP